MLTVLQVSPDTVDASRTILLPFGKFLLGFLVVYLAGRFLAQPTLAGVIRRRNRNNPTIREAVRRYLRLVFVLLALAAGITAAGYGQVLTRSAIVVAAATIAIGVAGQATIGNLVSGLFLVADPHFSVGDWIVWDDHEGVVEAITFRTTRVRTPNEEVITVPNTELTTSSISQPYGRPRHRVAETVGIGYDDDVDAAMSHLLEATAGQRAVLSDPEPRVYIAEFGDDAVVLQVQYWVGNPTRRDVLQVRSDIAREILAKFEAADITISPASQRELSGRVLVDRVDG